MKLDILENFSAGEKGFILEDGKRLSTLLDFYNNLKDMSSELFRKHKSRKDFSKWVRDVFQLKSLAQDIENCKTKDCVMKVLELFSDSFIGLTKDSKSNNNVNNNSNENKVENRVEDAHLREGIIKLENRIDREFRLQENRSLNETAIDIVNTLKSKIQDIESVISEHKKKGFELYKSWMLLRFANIKLKYAEKTLLKEDIAKVQKLIWDIEMNLKKEIEEESKIKKPITIKDIEELAKANVSKKVV